MKTKIAVLVGIALCTLLLISPALASNADTLGIYGNANEDDTIDMRDLTYVKLIFFGKKPETELADAKYDGKINPLDFIQIKLIIVGKEKEITIKDNDGDAVTVHKPVKRVIPDHLTSLVAMRVLDAEDMIVGIDACIKTKHPMGPTFLQDLDDLPLIGSVFTPGGVDYEAILNLNPDVYFSYRAVYGEGKETLRKKLPGVTVIETGYYEPYNLENFTMDMRKLGYILDRRDQAEEYIDWYNGYLDMIKERTARLSEDEKPRVYPEWAFAKYKCIAEFRLCDITGGINIGAGMGPGSVTVDPEWVIEQNPDVILSPMFLHGAYDTDDPSAAISKRDEILNRPELANVAAVKDGRAYLWSVYSIGCFPNAIIATAYIAKWPHPDLFEDLDPQAVHQEYLDRFSPLDFNVKEHGVFAYPEPS